MPKKYCHAHKQHRIRTLMARFDIRKIDSVMRLCVLLFLAGISGLSVSEKLEPYKDASVIESARNMDYHDEANTGDASKKYWEIRESQLTAKYPLQDYGMTCLILSFFLFVSRFALSVRSFSDMRKIKTPTNFYKIVLVGVSSFLLFYFCAVSSLFLDASRDEFPPWADSLGIPLGGFTAMQGPMMIILALALISIRIKFRQGLRIADTFSAKYRPSILASFIWGLPLFLSALSLGLSMAAGDFLSLTSSIMLSWFFLIGLASRQRGQEEE